MKNRITIKLLSFTMLIAFLGHFNALATEKAKKFSAKIKVDHPVTVLNGSNAGLSVVTRGGTAPFQYLWSNGTRESYLSQVPAGFYSVRVTDARGSVQTAQYEVPELNCQTGNCQYRTQTQGGWGSNPNGNNPGVYLHANFANAFPNGLTVGCTNTLSLTTAQAVTDFLPSGSTPSALPAGNLVNPGGSYNNVLAGQVVALSLSVGFDQYDANFAAPVSNLGGLVVASGTFAGWTVQQVLDEGNRILGGCASNYSPSTINAALSSINENYVDGTIDQGFLICNSTYTMSINVSSTDETCLGVCNGTATALATGGYGLINYLWSNQATGSSISALCDGTYQVIATDALNCRAIGNVTILPGSNLTVTPTATNESCYGTCDGAASVLVSGGTGPYNYLWSNQATGNSIQGLCQGNYSVTVTDHNGCSGSANVEILGATSSVTVQSSSSDITCFGMQNGEGHVFASGGSGNYLYHWSPNVSTTSSAFGLSAGTYNISVEDGNGCSAHTSLQVNEPAELLVSVQHSNANCAFPTGSASATVTGGNPPYNYLWLPGGYTTQSVANLLPGVYTVHVTDASGCTTQEVVTIQSTGLQVILVSKTDASCPLADDGSATVAVQGGQAPYSYSWHPVGGNGPSALNLAPGIFTVRVEDYLGCVAYLVVEIGYVDEYCYGARIASETKSANAFPNPFNDHINVNIPDASKGATIIITNASAKLISAEVISADESSDSIQHTIDLRDLSAGIYFMQITTENKTSMIRMIKN